MIPDIFDLGGATPYFLGAFFGGYLFGAPPFGLWLARLFGLRDPRAGGSGNIGAVNMLRLGGWRLGAATLILDAAKGALPVLLAWQYGPNTAVLAGFGAFLGHCYSPFLGFSGGKGVATAFGAFLAWNWWIALICAGVWLLVAILSRIASVASLSAAAAAAILFPYFEEWTAAWAVFGMGLITIWRHRENIVRLISGEEPRIGKRS